MLYCSSIQHNEASVNFKSKQVLIGFLSIVIAAIVFLVFNLTKTSNHIAKKGEVPIIIGFVQLGSESAWRSANSASVKSAAVDKGISLIFKNAEGSQKLQKQLIRDFIIQQVDVIIFPPLVADGWDEILAEAKEAGIPVIISDRRIIVKNPDSYSVFVGADFASEGRKAGKWLVNNTSHSSAVNIVELEGLAGSSPAIDRAKGFRQEIVNHPNMKIIESVPGDFIKVKGKLAMKKLLKKYGGNINVVYSHNDDMALGAIEAIKDYGLRPGKDILIVSVDGEKAALQAIKDGESNVSVECTPLLGPVLMQTARKLLNKEKLPKSIIMEEKTFTIKNVDKELPLRTY